jgi:mannose-6-phosphate isomerase
MLHAYLEGFGLELMANSDNVLRGGLTSKHVDVKELRNILYFRSSRPEIISADSSGNGFKEFVVPAGEFRLKTADITENKSVFINKNSGPSIIIVLENSITVSDSKTEMIFKRGESFFIPYSAPQLTIEGNGVIACAEAGK